MPKFKQILGFSGGGVRGIVTATWLDHLIKNKLIDLDKLYSISGTSTGSVIAAALCKPDPWQPHEISQLFKEVSVQVFKRKSWRPAWLDSVLFFAPHDIKKLREILEFHLGNSLLGDCRRNFVCVTYSLNASLGPRHFASSPLIIHSYDSPFSNNRYLDYKLVDCVAGSCAAPSYFKPYTFQQGDRYHIWTDGGLCSNASILSNYLVCRDQFTGEAIKAEEISALLLGNGTRYSHETKKSLAGWKTPRMLRALKDSIVQANEIYELKSLRRLLRSRFYYFNCPLPQEIELDHYDQVDFLESFAKDKIKHMGMLSSWLEGYFH